MGAAVTSAPTGPSVTKADPQRASASGYRGCGVSCLGFPSSPGIWALGVHPCSRGLLQPSVLMGMLEALGMHSPPAESSLPQSEPFLHKVGSAPTQGTPLKDAYSPFSLCYFPELCLIKTKLEEINIQLFSYGGFFFYFFFCIGLKM